MARWLVNLTLKVVEAEVVGMTPQGPTHNAVQQLEFQTRAEESGGNPAAALSKVIDRLHDWTNKLTEEKGRET